MPKAPDTQTPVTRLPRLPRQTHAIRLVRQSSLIAAVAVALAVTTGAGLGPESSQLELIMYSLGSALAIIMAIKIIFELRVYIVQTIVVLASFGLLCLLTSVVINAVSGG
jgi:hypothetical protein